ncbi:hypothetical protein H2199_008549 [Coniosporium tulheliwenetii]|uniref:Uncharacterized protein n=1 Tax=Coniosporium tulheliwenetii TaxID=3383036 RepID=A0ACC2YIG2_9PEZI|nr:hypothetical protein H2199_008549 [Cladosporium sp. JES 115]
MDIYATAPASGTTNRIGGGVSFSATGQVFGVDSSKMVPGATVYATQSFGGNTSPPAPQVSVQSALSVDPPGVPYPLFECARCLIIDGMLPGATAQVREVPAVLGAMAAFGGSVEVGVVPPLVAGHIVTSRQFYCGVPGPDTAGVPVISIKKREQRLPTPFIDPPLYACQQYVVIQGLTPGCDAELFVDGLPKVGACSGGTSEAMWVTLAEGTTITARQQFCGGTPRSNLSAGVVVQPAADIPRPAVRAPLYEGDASVVVAMTVSGEVVSIEVENAQIGMGGAGGGDASLNVSPALVAGQAVVATVELCKAKKMSLPVHVRKRPMTIPPPTVAKPLHACARLVTVHGCIPGAKVRVYATAAAKVLLGSARTFAPSIDVSVSPLLHAGWRINATQEVGGVVGAPSNQVVVGTAPAPEPPKLPKPIYECARCITVEAALPGARVDVLQDGFWIGAANAASTKVEVGVYPGLTAGAEITATQSICGKLSKPARAQVSQAPRDLLRPEITGAFAGSSSVVVKNLVAGAIVEIEETSVYNLVIGKVCSVNTSASVWLAVPLFAGAVLRARQRLCDESPFSELVEVPQPPNGHSGLVSSTPGFGLSPTFPFQKTSTFGHLLSRHGRWGATPVAGGGPFPLIAFGHAKRFPGSLTPVCGGAPADASQDYRQVAVILSQLARWGFVAISPDLSWLTTDGSSDNRRLLMGDAISYMLSANDAAGSPFNGKIKDTGMGALGHSSGGLAAIFFATSGTFPIKVLGLLAPAAISMADIAEIRNFAPRPVLIIHGTEDTGTIGVDGQPLSIYAAAGATKHLITITGANHFGYTDALCVAAPLDGTATINQADQQRIAKAYLTAFFRRYLTNAHEVSDYLSGVRQVEELEGFEITVDARL